MIRIEREPEPGILASKKAQWQQKFLEKRRKQPTARPDSSKYAHRDIKSALVRMSHGKCFYCESKPVDGGEVDHYVEVAADPSLAFDWRNLYLSCRRCNQAKRKVGVSVDECVDPCDPDSNPEDDLTFDDEAIRPHKGSTRGRATIRKYGLDSPLLDLQRSRALRELERARALIQERRIADKGSPLTADERETLLCFGQPERPFSAMLRVALRGLAL